MQLNVGLRRTIIENRDEGAAGSRFTGYRITLVTVNDLGYWKRSNNCFNPYSSV